MPLIHLKNSIPVSPVPSPFWFARPLHNETNIQIGLRSHISLDMRSQSFRYPLTPIVRCQVADSLKRIKKIYCHSCRSYWGIIAFRASVLFLAVHSIFYRKFANEALQLASRAFQPQRINHKVQIKSADLTWSLPFIPRTASPIICWYSIFQD